MNKLNEFEVIRFSTILIFIVYCIFKFYLRVSFSMYEFWFIYSLVTVTISSTNNKISDRKFWIPLYIVGFIFMILAIISIWGYLGGILMKKKREKILAYVLFIAFCITCIVSVIVYTDFYVFTESFSEIKIMYHEDLDEVVHTLRDIERDNFFKYYKQNDIYIVLKKYEDLRVEMVGYSPTSLSYVIVEETYKISNKYGKIPIEFSIIDKIYKKVE